MHQNAWRANHETRTELRPTCLMMALDGFVWLVRASGSLSYDDVHAVGHNVIIDHGDDGRPRVALRGNVLIPRLFQNARHPCRCVAIELRTMTMREVQRAQNPELSGGYSVLSWMLRLRSTTM